jgi:hypothetical protein
LGNMLPETKLVWTGMKSEVLLVGGTSHNAGLVSVLTEGSMRVCVTHFFCSDIFLFSDVEPLCLFFSRLSVPCVYYICD